MGMNRRQIGVFSSLNTVPINLIRIPIATAQHFGSAIDAFPGSATLAVGDEITMDVTTRAPDFGRNVTVDLNNAGASTGDIDIRVTGTNHFGKVISEDFTGLTKAADTQTGTKVFATITKVEVIAVNAATVSGDTLDFGTGSIAGIPVPLSALTDVVAITRDGTVVDVDADTIDLTENALKGDSANGAGSNSGVFAANDSFNILVKLTPSTVVDDVIT